MSRFTQLFVRRYVLRAILSSLVNLVLNLCTFHSLSRRSVALSQSILGCIINAHLPC
jgi:hypothetical protein